MKARELADLLQGEIIGNKEAEVIRARPIETAGPGDLAYFTNPKFLAFIDRCKASIVLISQRLELPATATALSAAFIRVKDPRTAFARALGVLHPPIPPFPTGIHPSAVIEPSAILGANVTVGPLSYVGENVIIGDNSRIGPNCTLLCDSEVGSNSILHSNVTIYHQCRIGNRVILHSGVVIGADGFGFASQQDGTWVKVPQIGIAVIEDDVEIGANSTVDRAALTETIVSKGTSIDNLVHVAHNCVIGENCVIAALTGISGSTKIGKNSIFAGQSGTAGHLNIAERTTVMARGGVIRQILEPGQVLSGFPARPHKEVMQRNFLLKKVPDLEGEIRALRAKLEEIREALRESKPNK